VIWRVEVEEGDGVGVADGLGEVVLSGFAVERLLFFARLVEITVPVVASLFTGALLAGAGAAG
jgi:hypothetical protein